MAFIASLVAAAVLLDPAPPPAAVTTFLSAVASGDLRAARGTLSPNVVILDDRNERPVGASLEAFAEYVRDCDRTDLTSEIDQADPARAVVSVNWTCPSGATAEAFIWTDATGVVHIQFGIPPQWRAPDPGGLTE